MRPLKIGDKVVTDYGMGEIIGIGDIGNIRLYSVKFRDEVILEYEVSELRRL